MDPLTVIRTPENGKGKLLVLEFRPANNPVAPSSVTDPKLSFLGEGTHKVVLVEQPIAALKGPRTIA